MKYYLAGDLLVTTNPESEHQIFRVRNTTERGKIITPDQFHELKPRELKNQRFSELMNIYFRDIKHEWVHDYSRYRKLPNFEVNHRGSPTNYKWEDLPKHQLPGWYGDMILVYHWGNIYYLQWSYNGYKSGQLADIYTQDHARWVRPQNCAPIFNIGTKKLG